MADIVAGAIDDESKIDDIEQENDSSTKPIDEGIKVNSIEQENQPPVGDKVESLEKKDAPAFDSVDEESKTEYVEEEKKTLPVTPKQQVKPAADSMFATASLKRKAADLAASEAKKPKANGSITSFFGAPKSNPSTSSTNPSKGPIEPAPVTFNKEEWIAKLSTEQKELLKLEIETLHESWLSVLKDEVTSREFLSLKRFLKSEGEKGTKIFPPLEDVYSWSRHTPLSTVKAVIIGQDPYHNFNQAHGLCFSVRPPTPAPPSLANIYKALKKDYPSFQAPPKNGGLLTPWADRGVLMLNACLTVKAHEANSHKDKGWEKFTQKVIDIVNERRRNGVVFLSWGSPAAKRVAKVDKKRHLVLQSVHPSPLSASRGFFDCGHFKKANEWLKQKYGEDGVIDWNLNVAPEDAGV